MAKQGEPKSEPMTYTVSRAPNVRFLMAQAMATGGEAEIPEAESQEVEVTTPTPKKRGK